MDGRRNHQEEDNMKELARPGFIYTVEHLDRDGRTISVEQVHNIIPTVGCNYILGTSLLGVSAFAAWYLGLFGAARTPRPEDTMQSFLTDCGEVVTYGNSRPILNFAPAANGSTSTMVNPNAFMFTGGATVRGAFIASSPSLGDNTGLLLSAALFNAVKIIAPGESLRVPAGFGFVSV